MKVITNQVVSYNLNDLSQNDIEFLYKSMEHYLKNTNCTADQAELYNTIKNILNIKKDNIVSFEKQNQNSVEIDKILSSTSFDNSYCLHQDDRIKHLIHADNQSDNQYVDFCMWKEYQLRINSHDSDGETINTIFLNKHCVKMVYNMLKSNGHTIGNDLVCEKLGRSMISNIYRDNKGDISHNKALSLSLDLDNKTFNIAKENIEIKLSKLERMALYYFLRYNY